MNHLEKFACEGLRTLVLAYRELPGAEATRWLAKFRAAEASVGDRAGALARCAERGVLAVESKAR